MRDVVVIGAGLAGLAAAIKAADAGLSVTLVTKGVGGIQLGTGTVDILGYRPEPVEAPLEALEAHVAGGGPPPPPPPPHPSSARFIRQFGEPSRSDAEHHRSSRGDGRRRRAASFLHRQRGRRGAPPVPSDSMPHQRS